MANWDFGEGAGVDCPVCNERCSGLDWILDTAGESTVGAQVFPCQDTLLMPPWRFGPSGSGGQLKFTRGS